MVELTYLTQEDLVEVGLLDFKRALREVKQGTDRYLMIIPDAGLAQLVNGKTVYPATPEDMASEVLN